MFKKNTIKINEGEFHYWEKNPNKPETILLLHGFPGNHGGLLDLARGLDDYRLIIPDMPSCGESAPLNGQHSLDKYVSWLDLFFKEIGLNKVKIIGHSFGARLALSFSSQYPERISKAVLITPVLRVEGFIAQLAALEYLIADKLPNGLKKPWLYNKLYRQAGNLIIYKSSGPERRKKLIADSNRELDRLNPQISIDMFNDFYQSDLYALADKIKNPALVIAGDRDEIAPWKSVKELADRMPGADFKLVSNAGHVVVLEKPKTTAGLIRAWL